MKNFLIGFDVYVFVLHFDIFFLSKLFCSRVKVPKSFFCIDFCNKLVIFIRGILEGGGATYVFSKSLKMQQLFLKLCSLVFVLFVIFQKNNNQTLKKYDRLWTIY